MIELWDYSRAAAYCGVPLGYFINVVKVGTGPNFIKTTPRKIMFYQRDLDAWMGTWVDRSGKPKGAPVMNG